MPKIKYLLLLVILGLILFSPTITAGFAFDDISQIVNNKYIHHKENLFLFLKSGIAAPGDKNGFFTFYYKPLPFMLYTLLFDYGHGNPLYFHIVQLFFFLLNVCLVFIFFSKFFSPRLSFILTLTFLVHPVSQTLAAYIADYFDTFSLFFGLLAFLTIGININLWRKIILSNILLLFSLLSKEAGILFIPAIILYGKLFSALKIKIYFISLLFMFGLYTWLRSNAYQNHFLTYLSSYPLEQPFLKRIFLIPTLIFYYYKEIFAPALSVTGLKEITQPHTSPLIILGVHLSLAIGGILYALFLKKHRPGFLKIFLFFASLFFLGLILYLQLIPLDTLIQRRWLSLSLLGALGIIGVITATFPIKSKKLIFTFRIFCAFYIIALTLVTIKLNLDLRQWWLHVAPAP